ncbi:MAG: hypothetical protein FWE95_08710 [Planctomycetaceae bacterium]|nr:hypothetical protein [Planctomycetaceae bacterium]
MFDIFFLQQQKRAAVESFDRLPRESSHEDSDCRSDAVEVTGVMFFHVFEVGEAQSVD